MTLTHSSHTSKLLRGHCSKQDAFVCSQIEILQNSVQKGKFYMVFLNVFTSLLDQMIYDIEGFS